MIIDTNISCLGKMQLLKDKNVDTVGRYYRVKTHPNWAITKAEAQELSKAGIKIFVVYEDYGNASDFTLTIAQGLADGAAALNQAQAIGQPEGSAIYFAVEGLPNGYKKADLPGVTAYFTGVKEQVKGKYAVGAYGDGAVCKHLLQTGLCQLTWLAAASYSFEGTKEFFAGGHWSLAQVAPVNLEADWHGLSIDINCANGDFGAFVVPFPVA